MAVHDKLYQAAIDANGAALARLARVYEADADRRRDLLQEIHIAVWRSLASFDKRCSLRTWVYRVAHNVAATHVLKRRRSRGRLVALEALETEPGYIDGVAAAISRDALSRLLDLVRRLKPLDRQIIVLHLEGESAASIAEVTGLSPENVATKIHRIKRVLRNQFPGGRDHG
ncbi:MAG: RNA polymerase sigma factor [Bryobacterales bacterium]|nr:RNA polymerase sigma factor [Bryobacterales bacterium]